MIISALRLRSTTAGDVRERRRSMREVTLLTSRFDEAKGRGLSDSDALEEAVGRRGEQAAESNNESWDLVTLVNWIIRERVPAEMACDQNAAISAFVDAVTEYSAANAPDPRSFLRWWDINGRRLYVQTPPDTMSVNLMTIHKSKGLQWPAYTYRWSTGTPFRSKATNGFLPADSPSRAATPPTYLPT